MMCAFVSLETILIPTKSRNFSALLQQAPSVAVTLFRGGDAVAPQERVRGVSAPNGAQTTSKRRSSRFSNASRQTITVWQSLTTRFGADVFCGVFHASQAHEVGFSPRLHRLLAERNLSLILDIYAADGPDENSEPTANFMAFPTWQNPLDWLTQCWNIALGRRVDPKEDSWLLGEIGGIAETAEQFIARISRENNLSIHRNEPGSGLIHCFEDWGIPINARVADFYRQTSDYEMETRTSWKPVFGSLGYLVAKLFSRRIQQLNLPKTSTDEADVFQSDIITLRDADGHTVYAIWHRSLKSSNEVVFYGIYGLCRIPSGELCVKAVFPLPRGSATVIFRASTDPKGNLELLSSGRDYGDPGFYFLVEDHRGHLWKHYLPSLRERIFVSESEGSGLKAEHTMSLWSLKVYSMIYTITENRRHRT